MASLLEEIHDDINKTERKIDGLIDQISDLIEEPEDATMIVPLVKEYMEVYNENKKDKIEIAKVVQRLEAAYLRSSSDDHGTVEISDAEKDEMRKLLREEKEKDKQIKELEDKKEEVIDDINSEIESDST